MSWWSLAISVGSEDSNRSSSLSDVPRVQEILLQSNTRDDETQMTNGKFRYLIHFDDNGGERFDEVRETVEPFIEDLRRLRKADGGHGHLLASLDQTHEHKFDIFVRSVQFTRLKHGDALRIGGNQMHYIGEDAVATDSHR